MYGCMASAKLFAPTPRNGWSAIIAAARSFSGILEAADPLSSPYKRSEITPRKGMARRRSATAAAATAFLGTRRPPKIMMVVRPTKKDIHPPLDNVKISGKVAVDRPAPAKYLSALLVSARITPRENTIIIAR